MSKVKYVAAPNDSRYIPFTQQKACCVPTSTLMIMYKNGIPLVPAEELGYRLGLTVSPDMASLFYNARTSPKPPTDAGYGTQVSDPRYSFRKAFDDLDIPLTATMLNIDDVKNYGELTEKLQEIESRDGDTLLCFDHGTVRVNGTHNGHVVVFDRLIEDKIRIIDASTKHPKWRLVEPKLMYEAMKNHPTGHGGLWMFDKN